MAHIIPRDPFDELFRGFFVRPVEFGGAADAPAMRVDVRETQDGYMFEAELPGVRKEDIHVNVEGETVTISAERRQEKEARDGERGERVLRSERSHGKVSRSFRLQQEVDDSRADARYIDGVLMLSLPKKAVPQARQIAIQ